FRLGEDHSSNNSSTAVFHQTTSSGAQLYVRRVNKDGGPTSFSPPREQQPFSDRCCCWRPRKNTSRLTAVS
ncbi:unnamed protein product, partial [Pylaiella littoralis]